MSVCRVVVLICVAAIAASCGCGGKAEPSGLIRDDLVAPLTKVIEKFAKIDPPVEDARWVIKESPDNPKRKLVFNLRLPSESAADLFSALRAESLRLAEAGGVNVRDPDSNMAVSPMAADSVYFEYDVPAGGDGRLSLILATGFESLSRDQDDEVGLEISPGEPDQFCFDLTVEEYPAE
jgi:hypothetical protein